MLTGSVSKRLNQQAERRSWLAPARIIKVVAVEPRAPVLQHPCDKACLEERLGAVLHHVSDLRLSRTASMMSGALFSVSWPSTRTFIAFPLFSNSQTYSAPETASAG